MPRVQLMHIAALTGLALGLWMALIALVDRLHWSRLSLMAAIASWLVAWAVMSAVPIVSPWIEAHFEAAVEILQN